jgi:hypothetical protein
MVDEVACIGSNKIQAVEEQSWGINCELQWEDDYPSLSSNRLLLLSTNSS